MSKYPRGPYTELNFFYHDISEQLALVNLVNHLLQHGGQLTENGVAHRGENIVAQGYGSVYDLEVHPINPNQVDWQSLSNNHVRIVSLEILNATGIDEELLESIMISNISDQAIAKCNHPIHMWTDGEVLDVASIERYLGENPEEVEKGKNLGEKLYKKFLEIIVATSPAYAAITTEWEMECPYDLVHNDATCDFSTFYVDAQAIGKEKVAQIQEIYQNAYIEIVHNGIYISSEWPFNPKQLHLEDIDDEVNSKVAKIIGSAFL